jgi:hypothetical protein
LPSIDHQNLVGLDCDFRDYLASAQWTSSLPGGEISDRVLPALVLHRLIPVKHGAECMKAQTRVFKTLLKTSQRLFDGHQA